MARKSRKNGANVEMTAVSADYKYKVAVYARLSHEKEETLERGTIENQVSFIHDYVSRHDDMDIVETYVDDSFSGSNFDRPGYMQMIEDMKNGRFNTIVVKDLSRLGREYVQVGNLIERVFPIYGVRFIAILDGYDSLNADTGIMMPVANIANTLYAHDISKKIISSKRAKMEQGIPVGVAPYGYKVVVSDDGIKKMMVDEDSGAVIRRIVDMFISGKKASEIARIFNEEGVPTPYQYKYRDKPEILAKKPNSKWNNEMFGTIFRNPVYRGTYVMGKERKCLYKHEERHYMDKDEWLVFENHHEPLITEEEYEEISRLRPKKRAVKKREDNILRGFMECGKCGYAMVPRRDHGKCRYFVCYRKSRFGIKECDCRNIREDKALDTVLHVIKEEMQALLDIDVLLEKLNHTKAADRHYKMLAEKIARAKQEIDKVISLKSSAYEDLSDGLIDEEEYRVLAGEYSARLGNLQTGLMEYEQLLSESSCSPLDKSDVKELIAKYRRKRTLSKDMVDALVEKIIANDAGLDVRLKFDDPLRELQRQVEERRKWSNEA